MKEKFSEKIKICMNTISRRKSCKVMVCSLQDWGLTATIGCEVMQKKLFKKEQNQTQKLTKPTCTDTNRKQKRAPSKKANDWHSLSLWDGHITVLAETLYFCSAMHNWHEWGDTESYWLNPAVVLVQVWGLPYYQLIIRFLESLLALVLLGKGCFWV